MKALYRLTDQGFVAYLVGGAVRDLLIGKQPKDFDIATDATPQKIKKLFRNCRIIGRRFRLAHLHYPGGKILELATFRSSGEADEVVRDGDMIRRDNVYGTPAEDALRRDLTINALYYDVTNFTVIDYVGGVDNLQNGVVRMIGDPDHSFHEDPVRMLRAVRHAGRTGFILAPETIEAMKRCRGEILKANRARLLEEFYKDLGSGHSLSYFSTLHEMGFLQLLMPVIADQLDDDACHREWEETLRRLDERVAMGARIHQVLGIAALISPELRRHLDSMLDNRTRRSGRLPKQVRDSIVISLQELKVYRKDADRFWNAVKGLGLVQRCVEDGRWAAEVSASPWARDAIEILTLLLGPGEGREQLLQESFKFPEVEQPLARSRRRRPGGGGRRPSAANSDENGGTGAESKRPRRRRRRRSGRSRGPSEA